MSLTTQTRSTLAGLIRRHPDRVKTVSANGVSVQGLMGTELSTAALTNQGDQGRETQKIRVDVAALPQPADGATIKIDGKDCEVLSTRILHEAFLAIEFLAGKSV